MKYRFNASIRGNIEYSSLAELQSAIKAGIESIEGFTLTNQTVEVWQEDGSARVFDSGLYRFTIQLGGNILADSSADVEAVIEGFTTAYPDFTLTYQNIEAWQDGSGNLKQFNDDGSEYVEETDTDDDTDTEEVTVEEVTESQEVNHG